MIELAHLNYTYSDGTIALEDVSATLTFTDTENITAVVGESGSGKTTLMQCLARFLEPQQGVIRIDGRELSDFGEQELRRLLGVVFQELYLFPHLTVMENLTLAMRKVLGQERTAARCYRWPKYISQPAATSVKTKYAKHFNP